MTVLDKLVYAMNGLNIQQRTTAAFMPLPKHLASQELLIENSKKYCRIRDEIELHFDSLGGGGGSCLYF